MKIRKVIWLGAGILILVSFGYYYINWGIYRGDAGVREDVADEIAPTVPVYGVWIWQSPDQMDEERVDQIIEFSKIEKINRLYVSVDRYMDIYEMPPSAEKTDLLIRYEAAWLSFLTRTKEAGIGVEALAGNTLWGNSSHQYIPQEILEYTLSYNLRHPENKFEGVQFDIEFYNQTGFEEDKITYTTEYLDTVSRLVYRLRQARDEGDFRIGLAIPYWLETNNGLVPTVKWKGEKQPIFYSVIDILNQIPNGYLVLMSYRNKAEGINGAISLSKREIEYISTNYPKLSVLVGQETRNNEDLGITYYGKPKQDFFTAIRRIAGYFQNQPSFKGLVIHDIDGYMKLIRE